MTIVAMVVILLVGVLAVSILVHWKSRENPEPTWMTVSVPNYGKLVEVASTDSSESAGLLSMKSYQRGDAAEYEAVDAGSS